MSRVCFLLLLHVGLPLVGTVCVLVADEAGVADHVPKCVQRHWQSYEPKYYYMEVVLLLYKLVMSAVVVLFMPGTLAQVSPW